jgi:hypothetical protein
VDVLRFVRGGRRAALMEDTSVRGTAAPIDALEVSHGWGALASHWPVGATRRDANRETRRRVDCRVSGMASTASVSHEYDASGFT